MIRPHKGGRTETVNARLTPDEKAALKAVTNAAGLSLSDWIMQQVNAGDNMANPKKMIIVNMTWYEDDSVVVFTIDNPGSKKPRRLHYETSAENVVMEPPEKVVVFGEVFDIFWYPFRGYTENSLKPCIHLYPDGNTELHKFILNNRDNR